jgi:hypothetical protein
VLALALVLLAGRARAEDSPSAPPPQSNPDVQHALDEMQRKLDEQGRELAELRTQLQAQARSSSRPAGAFRVGGLRATLGGYVQADAVAYDEASVDELNPSTGDPLNQERFLIRRARLRVEADYTFVGGVLEFDGNTVNGPTARVSNAEVWLKLPNLDPTAPPFAMAVLGLTRIPFGFEVQEKDYVRLFLERSNVMRALFPGEFDLGVKLQGAWRFVRYQVAAMNGAPAGDKQYTLRDPNHSKDFIGRLGVDTALGRVGVQAGVSALYGTGFRPGTPATKNTVQWNDANNDGQVDATELTGVIGMPAIPSQDFNRYALGGDVRLTAEVPRLGELALYAELVWAANLDRALVPADPVTAGRDLREVGWYIAATQQLTKWAALGVRYDRYDPDADHTELQAGTKVARDLTFSTLALALAVAYPPYGRLTLEWDHNTNALGRTVTGAPTTLDANVITLRGQLVF